MYYYINIYYEQDSEGQLQDESRKILSTHFERRFQVSNDNLFP